MWSTSIFLPSSETLSSRNLLTPFYVAQIAAVFAKLPHLRKLRICNSDRSAGQWPSFLSRTPSTDALHIAALLCNARLPNPRSITIGDEETALALYTRVAELVPGSQQDVLLANLAQVQYVAFEGKPKELGLDGPGTNSIMDWESLYSPFPALKTLLVRSTVDPYDPWHVRCGHRWAFELSMKKRTVTKVNLHRVSHPSIDLFHMFEQLGEALKELTFVYAHLGQGTLADFYRSLEIRFPKLLKLDVSGLSYRPWTIAAHSEVVFLFQTGEELFAGVVTAEDVEALKRLYMRIDENRENVGLEPLCCPSVIDRDEWVAQKG